MKFIKLFILIPMICVVMILTFSFDAHETQYNISPIDRALYELEKEYAKLLEQGVIEDGKVFTSPRRQT